MKKQNKQSGRYNPSPVMVSARFDHSWFLADLVEELANEKQGHPNECSIPAEGWDIIHTSSIEAGVSGNVIFSDFDLHAHFTTGFVFICTRTGPNGNKLTWSNSLS